MDIFGQSKRSKLIQAYRELFLSDVGKEVLNDLCKSCHIHRTTMETNPHEMAYKEGERSVILRILKTIEIDPFDLQRKINASEKND